MSRVKKYAVLCGTMLMIGIGVTFPGFVFRIQEKQLSKKISTYETDMYKLTFAEQILDKMRLFSGNYRMMGIDSGNNLNSDTAYQAMLEIIKYYENHAFEIMNSSGIKEYSVQPFLAISSDCKTTAVVWECSIKNEEKNCIMLTLDDETGKLLRLEIYKNGYYDYSGKKAQIEESTELFVDIVKEYYGLDVEILKYNGMQDSGENMEYFDVKIGAREDNPVLFKLMASEEMFLFIPE